MIDKIKQATIKTNSCCLGNQTTIVVVVAIFYDESPKTILILANANSARNLISLTFWRTQTNLVDSMVQN